MSKRKLIADTITEELHIPLPDFGDVHSLKIPATQQGGTSIEMFVHAHANHETLCIEVRMFAQVKRGAQERIHYLTQQHINLGRYQWRWLLKQNASQPIPPTFTLQFSQWQGKFTAENVQQYFYEQMLGKGDDNEGDSNDA